MGGCEDYTTACRERERERFTKKVRLGKTNAETKSAKAKKTTVLHKKRHGKLTLEETAALPIVLDERQRIYF